MITGCAQQFGEQGVNIGRNAWLEAGVPADRDPGDHDRPPVRLRPAGGQLRRGADRLRRPRRRDRRRRRAHGPHLLRRRLPVMKEHGAPFSPRADGALQPDPAGLSAEMIADQWEIPAPSSTSSACAPSSSPPRRPRRAASSARSIPFAVNGDTYATDQGLRETTLEGLAQLEAGLQGGRQDHRRQLLAGLRRRRGVLLMAREKARPRAAGRCDEASTARRRGSSTRPRSASTR